MTSRGARSSSNQMPEEWSPKVMLNTMEKAEMAMMSSMLAAAMINVGTWIKIETFGHSLRYMVIVWSYNNQIMFTNPELFDIKCINFHILLMAFITTKQGMLFQFW